MPLALMLSAAGRTMEDMARLSRTLALEGFAAFAGYPVPMPSAPGSRRRTRVGNAAGQRVSVPGAASPTSRSSTSGGRIRSRTCFSPNPTATMWLRRMTTSVTRRRSSGFTLSSHRFSGPGSFDQFVKHRSSWPKASGHNLSAAPSALAPNLSFYIGSWVTTNPQTPVFTKV